MSPKLVVPFAEWHFTERLWEIFR